jgi:hypothetical protein
MNPKLPTSRILVGQKTRHFISSCFSFSWANCDLNLTGKVSAYLKHLKSEHRPWVPQSSKFSLLTMKVIIKEEVRGKCGLKRPRGVILQALP